MRVRRLIRRIVLGLLAFIVVAIVGLVIFIHTDAGREVIRKQVEARINEAFRGGGTVGTIEGSAFGTLTIHDVVINGPDGEPAISAKTVKLGLGILPLISKKAILSSVVAEDVDVRLERDQDGQLEFEYLLRPAPSTGWSLEIPDLEVHRAHVLYETGDGSMNFDQVEVFGAVHMMFDQPLRGTLSVSGAWRERAVGLALDAVVKLDDNVLTAPLLIARAGAVIAAGTDLRVIFPRQPSDLTASMVSGPFPAAPVVSGTVVVSAPAVGVALLAPGVQMPDDIAFAANIGAYAPWTHVSLMGRFGLTPVRALLDADLDKLTASGIVTTGDLNLTVVTGGRLDGIAGGIVSLNAEWPKEAGEWPRAQGVAALWGQIARAQDAHAAIAFDTSAHTVRTVIGARSKGLRATIDAQISQAGDVLKLDRGVVIGSSEDPSIATGGQAPLHGALWGRLEASGRLSPEPNLAVAGNVEGLRLRFQDLSVARMRLAIDARQLPRQPIGKAELELSELMRGTMELGQLKVSAANRADGKIQVTARSRPKQAPWLVDVDALVTPPGKGDVVAIDIQNHHVRAGAGGNWCGKSGHIEIGPRRIVVRDLASTGAQGKLALAGDLNRNTGDLTAKVDATSLTLDNLDPAYRGTVDAHVDIARVRGRITGTADIKGTGMAVGNSLHTFDVAAKIAAGADKLAVDATATSTTLGSAKLALDVDPPKDITNVEQWKHLHRQVIRTGQLSFQHVDLAKLADLAGYPDEITTGRLDGDVMFSADATGGMIQVRDVMLPVLRGTGAVNADLRMAQTGPGELEPSLTGTVDSLGKFVVAAKVGVPDHLFDLAAWRALGPRVLHGATARVDNVMIDPALLDRFGIVTNLRGKVSLGAEVTEAMESAQVSVDIQNLRGSPLVQPVDTHFAAAIDDTGANTQLAVRSGKIALLDVSGRVPVTMAQLRANPEAVMSAPLNLTASLPSTPAPALLGVFGRAEVVGGTLAGTVKITGTLAKPKLVAKVTGSKIQVPPGPRNRPIKVIESMTIDGTYEDNVVDLKVDGLQKDGSLDVVGHVDLRDLGAATVKIDAKAFDLTPLLAFAPGPAGGASGRLDAKLTVSGLEPDKMRVAGALHLKEARMPILPQIGTLRRAKIDIVVDEREMKIDVAGRLGGGDVTLASRFQLDGAMPSTGDVTLKLRKVSPIGTIEPDVSADITAKLNRQGDQWNADVFVKNGDVKVPSGRHEALDPIGAPKDMVFAVAGQAPARKPEKKGPPSHPTLTAHITLYSTNISSEEAHALVKGNVTVTADGDAVGVVGSIEADRGDLDLFGRRYAIEQAAVHFDGSTDPLLDMRITHDFADVTTITIVRGRLSKPELVMESDPGTYSQGQLLGFLLGGEPSGDPQDASMRDKATTAGASVIANKLSGYVKKALPIDIDVLRYESATASSSAAVLVGTWLTRSLFVAFRQRLGSRVDENRSEAEVEYWLSRRVSAEATAGDRGYNGVDLLWRKRY